VDQDVTIEQQMVDQLIDRGVDQSPATDWTLMVPDEVALLLPMDSDTLLRPIGQLSGYYRTQVYCDREVVTFPLTEPIAVLSDVDGLMPSLYLNLGSGAIGTSPADVGLSGG
jgi:hypothetical protein